MIFTFKPHSTWPTVDHLNEIEAFMFSPEAIKLNCSAVEFLTERSWGDLYKRATRTVPYYLLGCIKTEREFHCYDGISLLKKNLTVNSLDPATGKKILRIYYAVKDCLAITFSRSSTVIKEATKVNHSLKHFHTLPEEFFSPYTKYAFCGIDFHGAEREEALPYVLKCQVIVSEYKHLQFALPWKYYVEKHFSAEV